MRWQYQRQTFYRAMREWFPTQYEGHQSLLDEMLSLPWIERVRYGYTDQHHTMLQVRAFIREDRVGVLTVSFCSNLDSGAWWEARWVVNAKVKPTERGVQPLLGESRKCTTNDPQALLVFFQRLPLL